MARSEARTRFLEEVIIGAVEGGTGYWAQVSDYQYRDGETVALYCGERAGDLTRAVLHPLTEDGNGYQDEGLVLDVDAVARGLGRIERHEVKLGSGLRAALMQANRTNDAGEVDSDGADVIAQAGLLGDVLYG